MVSDARALSTRLPVPVIARPDYPGNIAAKRLEFICRSSGAACLPSVGIPLTVFFSRTISRTSRSPVSSRWRLMEGDETSFEIAH
jgi:hypothetical protein